MARRPETYRRIHAAANGAERRLIRAFRVAAARARAHVKLVALADAIAAGDFLRAERAAGIRPEATNAPLGAITRDAFLRGGKEGALVVNGLRR